MLITRQYLKDNPSHVFVFGDNLAHRGFGGAAKLRGEPNTYGFLTKKWPNNKPNSFYSCDEYKTIFKAELAFLCAEVKENPDKLYLISKLGAGLANKHKIWENVIRDGLEILAEFDNVKFLYRRDT